MLSYNAVGYTIEVNAPNVFTFIDDLNNVVFSVMTREHLEAFRHIIDQALNTSAEELNDDVA